MYFPETGFAPCAVYSRYSLKPGMTVDGPAVVEEREYTTVIGPSGRATVDKYLNLIVDLD